MAAGAEGPAHPGGKPGGGERHGLGNSGTAAWSVKMFKKAPGDTRA